MDNALQTLFAPVESGAVRLDGRVLFMGARAHSVLDGLGADLWQVWKPFTARISSVPALPDGPYAHVLVLLPKQVEEAKFWLALALERLEMGGTLMAAAANDAGGNRIEGWFKDADLIPQSHSKNKARVVWATRPATLSPIIADWHISGQPKDVIFGDGLQLKSQPGLFSWDRPDAGSQLLTTHLPSDLKGNVADFGTGIGYLSHHILRSSPAIKNLYVLEADARALALARENLGDVHTTTTLHFGWHDLTLPVRDLPALDAVIMNPPFHAGKKADDAIGQKFIATAAHHMKKSGSLWMVANTHLPYEKILAALFKDVQVITKSQGYKIIRAVKG